MSDPLSVVEPQEQKNIRSTFSPKPASVICGFSNHLILALTVITAMGVSSSVFAQNAKTPSKPQQRAPNQTGPAQSKPAARQTVDPKIQQKKQIVLREIKDAFDRQDDLQLRVMIKLFASYPMSSNEWSFVRKAIHRRPSVGFDLMNKWDQVRPGGLPPQSREYKIDNLLANADTAMAQENFDMAFRYYQLLAKFLKKEIILGKRENYYLYWSCVHGMARALFGAGRFKESLQVYSWIGSDYYRYRQTLFEKMWAAFRANRIDAALGAIASQQSSYFSDFLEPESYLVQAYVYKKLCRDDELKKVRELIRFHRKRLDQKNGNYKFEDWVRSDVELMALFKLTEVPLSESDTYFNRKKLEQTRILQLLQSRFSAERERLSKQMDLVLGYTGLSIGLDRLRVNTEVVPDRARLMKSNREFWPADSAEDWADEQGGHLYLGESACPEKLPEAPASEKERKSDSAKVKT